MLQAGLGPCFERTETPSMSAKTMRAAVTLRGLDVYQQEVKDTVNPHPDSNFDSALL